MIIDMCINMKQISLNFKIQSNIDTLYMKMKWHENS